MQLYKCDVCSSVINNDSRRTMMLKGPNDLCISCAKDIMNYIDILKTIPVVKKRMNSIHKQLFEEE